MNKILVLGSSGLVGSALKQKLEDGDHIFHTRNDVDLLNYNTTNEYIKFCVEQLGVTTIINCAAKVGGVLHNLNENYNFFLDNYKINNNVISAGIECNLPKLVNITSTCVFPDKNITYPITHDQIENGPPHYTNFGYSYSKRISQYQISGVRKALGLDWINVIPCNVYGTNDNFHERNSHVIPGLIHKAYLAKNKNTEFVVWGDGTPKRQFINSIDLSNNILWAIDNWNFEYPFMCVNKEEYTIKEIVSIICDKFDISSDRVVYDFDKPNGQLKKPASSDIPDDYKFIELKQGLIDTIDWFIENYENLKK